MDRKQICHPFRSGRRLQQPYDARRMNIFGTYVREAVELLDSPASIAFDRAKAIDPAQGGDLGTLESTLIILSTLPGWETDEKWLNSWTRERLRELADAYRVALPFDEAERSWLEDTRLDAWDAFEAERDALVERGLSLDAAEMQVETPHERLIHYSGQVISAGVLKPVSGSSLLARWSDWRAGRGVYEGQQSLERAQARMHELAAFCLSAYDLVPYDQPWPPKLMVDANQTPPRP